MLDAFNRQRGQAKSREIAFKMTFDQWASVWLEGGKWDDRGRRTDQYAMGRLGDLGAYEVGNVKIITVAQNGFEAQSGRQASVEARIKRSVAMTGRKFTEEHRAKLSAANSGKKPWRGRPVSDETRSKMAIAAKATWATRKLTAA